MIYKVETENSFTEVEATDTMILIHIVDGFHLEEDNHFKRIINLEFSKKNVQELIRSLEFAIKDYEEEEAKLSLRKK